MSELAFFIGALGVAYIVPGPDMILLLQTGASRGRRAALMTAIGLAMARAAHVALAALGLATLFRASPSVFDVVRLAGAAYLVWLGIGILRAPSLVPQPVDAVPRHAEDQRAVVRGLLTNLLNPKALLFCSVLLPQFLRPDGGPLSVQFLILGIILVGTGILFDVQYALAGDRVGAFLSRRPVWQHVQRWVFGSVLIGFGAQLIAGDRA